MKISRFLASILCFSVCFSAISAESAPQTAEALYREAEKLLEDDDDPEALPKAVKLLKEAIRLDDPMAMVQLIHLSNMGVKEAKLSDAEILSLLERGAKKEFGPALLNLGAWYTQKEHRDDVKAADCFRRALAVNQPGAGIRFGYCCLAGRGVAKDAVRGAEAFHADAVRGLPEAQNLYGVCLFNGTGVTQNFAESRQWVVKAAEQGYMPALNNLGIFYRNENTKDGYRNARLCFEKAAKVGYAPAIRNLAQTYLQGEGGNVDFVKARELAESAASKGDHIAWHVLGMMHLYGYGMEKDPVKAFEAYRKSAELGYAPACLQVSEMYRNGIGVKADSAKADEWQRAAACTERPGNDEIGRK